MEYFKRVLKVYDKKIEVFNSSLNDHIIKLECIQNDLDGEMA